MRSAWSRAWLSVSMALVDLALVNVAFMVAYWLRYTFEVGRQIPEESFVSLEEYFPLQLMLSVVLTTAFIVAGLYRKPIQRGLVDEIALLLSSSSVGMMVILASIFLFQAWNWSRLLFIYVWALTLILLSVWRLVKRRLVVAFYHRGLGVRRALVVGNNPISLMVMHLMTTDVGLGYKLLGFVADGDQQPVGRFSCLGSVDQLGEVIDACQIDEVVIAVPPSAHRLIFEIASDYQENGVTFKVVPDLYELSLRQLSIDDLRGVPLIRLQDAKLSGASRLLKRSLDIAISLAVLMGLSPLWLVIGAAIWIDSPGPVLFRQKRVGRDGEEFEIFKFRSMRQTAEHERATLEELNEAEGPIFKIREDPRRTRSGRFIRRLSLDEVPQFINVLFGDMSVVGPRPLIPEEVAQQDDWHRKRLQVQPGMTGLWQVSGRSDLPFDEMVLLDIYYIENWSLGMDIKILTRTIPAVLSGRGAY
ncbi:MAG: sugar transferase [Dehalococcoidia bacterium]